MHTFNLPFGKEKIKLELPEEQVAGVLVSHAHEYKAPKSEAELVADALANPIGSPKLSDLAKGKKNCVIISSDHTRPVPSHVIMPQLLAELRKGNPDIDITILIATGMHRATTKEELIAKYGKEIAEHEKFVIHVSRNDEDMVSVGTLPSGGDCRINKVAANADLLISEGFIEPHFFAGMSGGRKSVLPGIASKVTVLANHCSEFINSPHARTGILQGNPIHEDMLYAAKAAKLAFICNVVIDADKKVIAAFAGDREKAHYAGADFEMKLAGVKPVPADIVITTNGGYPLDQNIYQSVKGMTAAEATCKEGGVIIDVSSCSDGHGGEDFYNNLKNAESIQKAMDEILARGRNETVFDQWEAQILMRMLLKFTIIMVTEAPQQMVEDMHMKYAASVDDALAMAKEVLAKKGITDPKITVIPDGVSVIVK
ncbi:MAG: nickel-dependent lactate racemase [Megasphaera elsdenii]|uniref:nickel-dependent lactate racemase n=1 Tax=Megasphaera elsdenii TaxID=907 RepID=UPI0014768082|nr:nickel-dependent lactate racemase [Megasphaera elsdenii]MCI7216655.1 nickel-dependent lactate racemase [Megasphaera elsdenii]MDD7071240.1 nickel-dependent lactate racemase [Megasphaera elsdenii]MDD7155934.1 nickel-dependent lactate racemase [Megasphaera elsdenii]MDY3269661.1 nickel-dependent lactate racemase [Megasphaera elsdenii]MDY5386543.1 nickel-dependent lactate racemase [Megasphaera elsdenii]